MPLNNKLTKKTIDMYTYTLFEVILITENCVSQVILSLDLSLSSDQEVL